MASSSAARPEPVPPNGNGFSRSGAFDAADTRAHLPLPPGEPCRRGVEERYRRMVEAAPSAIILINHAGEIETVNRQAERILGYGRQDLVGRHFENLVPYADGLRRAALRRGQLAHAQNRKAAETAELVARRGDGTHFPVEIDLNPIETEEGPMVVAAMTDVTERREAGAARDREAQNLAQSNTDLQEFVYIASHDLRAPIRAISLLADWIADDLQGSASLETLDNLRLMRQRAGRLEMLLDGLLTYSSVGHVNAVRETVDLAALVTDIADLLAPPPTFRIDFQGSVTRLHTPRAPLTHVLQNLIGNAIRHHDKAKGTVQVCARQMPAGTEFSVHDDGPGIDPAYHKKIFAIFQTLSSRDDCETSGVGLSIVQKTVESRGGRVWIESEPPRRGTVFRFLWPDTREMDIPG